MSEKDIVGRNVALLLEHDHPLEQQFIKWSNAIGEQIESNIHLNRTNMRAHISLYNVPFPKRNLQEVERRLSTFAPTISPVPLRFEQTSRVLEYVFVDAVVTAELKRIHLQLISLLNDLREGAIYPTALETAARKGDSFVSNIREVGMLMSRDDFQPHVTVAASPSEQEAEAALAILPRRLNKETNVPALHLVETGPFGTCKTVLNKFTLSDQE